MEGIELARECLLSLFAEASRFEEDCDGETFPDGHRTFTCNYHLTVPHGALTELCEAVGIEVRFDELPGDAIKRALAKPAIERAERRREEGERETWDRSDLRTL